MLIVLCKWEGRKQTMALDSTAQGISSCAPEQGRTPRGYHAERRVGVLDSEAYSFLAYCGLRWQDSFLSFFFSLYYYVFPGLLPVKVNMRILRKGHPLPIPVESVMGVRLRVSECPLKDTHLVSSTLHALNLALSPLDVSTARAGPKGAKPKKSTCEFHCQQPGPSPVQEACSLSAAEGPSRRHTMAEILGQFREGEHSRSIPACLPFSEPHPPTRCVGDTAQWLRYR